MSDRGQGRIFRRATYLWIAYYSHGKEQREVARHIRTGEKLEASEKNRHKAERFLKRRLGEIAAEQHGGRAFVGPQQERIWVSDLLDGLEQELKLRDKWNFRIESNMKRVRPYFGTSRAVEITSAAIDARFVELREQGRST